MREIEYILADVAVEKQSLRRILLKRRAAISDVSRNIASARFAEIGLSCLPVQMFPSVSAFSSYNGEPDTLPLMTVLCKHGCKLCLPLIGFDGKSLVFRVWMPGMHLISGMYGIDVPPEDSPIILPDLLLTPLLGFDAMGNRIGYGGGYYDRSIVSLRRRKKVFVVGLAFAIQEVKYVPHECHDERLDAILTEDGYRSFHI